MPQITSEQAIRKASEYLKSIPEELLGETVAHIRLETVQLFDNEWVVVLSYVVEPQSVDNVFLKTLGTYRRFREITVDSATGLVKGMRTPDDSARIERTLR